ncbi:acetyl esterase/lipase [Micrococcus cohnii]|uniref:Acetyl esterase/lipase n=1 Tax=Micrococcus cohnii TaxID=993416 RepID=A0A7W7M4A2_9MICC|nr:alpha/beta hydrolase [Micrococcus cohnii]MBB4736501.1 acetyl esterase/lipase [Micrococcus cohnii]
MQRRTVLSVVGTTAPLGALGVGVASGHVGGARPDAPVERSAGVVARRGLRYARLPDRAGVLDLYRPPGVGPFPVLMWTSGSGWTSDAGNRDGEDLARALVPHGWAVAAYSTRSSAQATFPAHVHDANAAVRWLRAEADTFDLDSDRIAIGGSSSGGWTALMVGYTTGRPGYDGTVGGHWGTSSAVRAVVDFYAPVHLRSLDEHMRPGACRRLNEHLGTRHCHADDRGYESRMLGRPVTQTLALADEASPLHHVHGQAPPTLIVHGTGDDVVPEEQSAVLYEALVRHGVPSAHYEVRGGEHVVGLGQNGTAAARVRSQGLPEHVRRPAFSAEAVVGFLDAVV